MTLKPVPSGTSNVAGAAGTGVVCAEGAVAGAAWDAGALAGAGAVFAAGATACEDPGCVLAAASSDGSLAQPLMMQINAMRNVVENNLFIVLLLSVWCSMAGNSSKQYTTTAPAGAGR
jgi:hypothetical protein